jgi:nucleoside-diphosphate-sugar epimerase
MRPSPALHRNPLPSHLCDHVICEYGFDVRSESSVNELFLKYKDQIKAVWNLAAPLSVDTAKDPSTAYDTTVEGMKRVLNAMLKNNINTLYFSDSIGSFGASSPRENSSAMWLIQNPTQDPGSDYGVQKRECRKLMSEFEVQYGFDTRFAIIPGVLHSSKDWGGGTTEYALDALWAAVNGHHYRCPVSEDTMLPMIHSTDLINGLIALMNSPLENFPHGMSPRGSVIAGFSFSPRQLFSEIQKYYPAFSYSFDSNFNPSAALFSELWPNSLDKEENETVINFVSQYDLASTVSDIINAHKRRIETNI